jgi:hypothetical protein
MTKQMKFTFHRDDNHGWLEISNDDLQALGLRRSDFSVYSYQNSFAVFAEEDCDAALAVEMHRCLFNTEPVFSDKYHAGDAPMRSMSRCGPIKRNHTISRDMFYGL